MNQIQALDWAEGPGSGKLGNLAEIAVPEGYAFLGLKDARRFLELTQNIPGDELGLIAPITGGAWFVLFTFQDIGYVKDDERDKLDASAILQTIEKGNEQANKERRKRGWPTMSIHGWYIAPEYDVQTNNLEWAIRGSDDVTKSVTVNHATRLLGRRGVMNVDLICPPEQFDAATSELSTLLGGYSFTTKNRYAEYREGDQLAKVGLTGLILGGAAVAAVKSGFWAKFLKPLLLGLFALLAGVGRWVAGFIKRASGREEIG